jgi:hypothetical protein
MWMDPPVQLICANKQTNKNKQTTKRIGWMWLLSKGNYFYLLYVGTCGNISTHVWKQKNEICCNYSKNRWEGWINQNCGGVNFLLPIFVGGTLWHLIKFLHYIIVEFTPSITLLYCPSPHSWNNISLIFPFSYMST